MAGGALQKLRLATCRTDSRKPSATSMSQSLGRLLPDLRNAQIHGRFFKGNSSVVSALPMPLSPQVRVKAGRKWHSSRRQHIHVYRRHRLPARLRTTAAQDTALGASIRLVRCVPEAAGKKSQVWLRLRLSQEQPIGSNDRDSALPIFLRC